MAPRQNAASKASIFLMASAVLARSLAYGSTLIERYARAILSVFESLAGLVMNALGNGRLLKATASALWFGRGVIGE